MTQPSAASRSGRAGSRARAGTSAGRTGQPPRSPGPTRRRDLRGSARRRATIARRRRRAIGALLVAAVVAGVVLFTMPLAKRAVNDAFGLPLRYAATIRQQAADKHLDPALVAAVIYAETKFEPRTSSTGAVGLMQVEPQTALYLAHRSGATTFTTADLDNPSVNIAYGSYYLRELLDEYHGSKLLALAAYNGGAGNVNTWEHDAESHGHTLRVSEIPFPETRAYVAKVLHAQREYHHRYARQLGYD